MWDNHFARSDLYGSFLPYDESCSFPRPLPPPVPHLYLNMLVHFSILTAHLIISVSFIFRAMPGLKRGEEGSDDEFESSMDGQIRERDRRERERDRERDREAKTPKGVRPQQVGVGVLVENMIAQPYVLSNDLLTTVQMFY
jgi:hypothetical protein